MQDANTTHTNLIQRFKIKPCHAFIGTAKLMREWTLLILKQNQNQTSLETSLIYPSTYTGDQTETRIVSFLKLNTDGLLYAIVQDKF
jgi:hypothetical protein